MSIEKPTGNAYEITDFSDDSFFHLLCHIEPALIAKIEKGEFIDLEKLLPPDKFNKTPADPNRLEFRHVDGATFLAPVSGSREKRITHIRRWEQAFHVYASIYCCANPLRTTEIWQYIYVINSAATAYTWDNVSRYDYMFRQLMAFNPKRNWGIIYNHMWNLAMTEPISKSNSRNDHGKSGNRRSSEGSNDGRDISDYCWSFNRGFCKFGSSCDFINRCNYYDSKSHGADSCDKLMAKKQWQTGGENNRSRKHHKREEKIEKHEGNKKDH